MANVLARAFFVKPDIGSDWPQDPQRVTLFDGNCFDKDLQVNSSHKQAHKHLQVWIVKSHSVNSKPGDVHLNMDDQEMKMASSQCL